MKNRIKSFSEYTGINPISENLQYHIDNSISIVETVFRPGSHSHIEILKEARELYSLGKLKLGYDDAILFDETDLGKVGVYEGHTVPLDLPLEDFILNEAKYKGREVKLNYPTRGGSKKFKVYVRNPKTGNVKMLQIGDTTGLKAKVSDPKARKSFAARHKCSTKKDKTKAGYWSCRINKYAHLWGGKTYPGYW
tara:strand:- start:3007 stop:3588 length:582 start_codon:yes stop_codon:yes gene_type:complete